MERGVRLEQVQHAIEVARSRGIESGMFLMWGYEGEELSDIEATVEHVKRSKPDIFFTTVAYPIKGTPYYEQVADRLVIQLYSSLGRRAPIATFASGGGISRGLFMEHADRLLRHEVALACESARTHKKQKR